MLTLTEFEEKYPDRLSKELVDWIFENPKNFEKFMLENLVESTDDLRIRDTLTPIGIKREYVAIKPDGTWRKQSLVFAHNDIEVDPIAFVKEQTICAYKWILSGRRIEDWDMATPENIDRILEDIKKLTAEEVERAQAERKIDNLIFSNNSN